MGVRASYQVKPKQTGMFVFRIESHLSQWERVKARERVGSFRSEPVAAVQYSSISLGGGRDGQRERERKRGQEASQEPVAANGKMASNLAKNKKKLNPNKLKKGIRRSCVQKSQRMRKARENG